MKPSFTGQRSVPATDQKFRPTDEHLIEENKEEVESSEHSDKMEPEPKQNSDKFAEIDRNSEKKE